MAKNPLLSPDIPCMADVVFVPGEPDAVINVGVAGPGAVKKAIGMISGKATAARLTPVTAPCGASAPGFWAACRQAPASTSISGFAFSIALSRLIVLLFGPVTGSSRM